MGTRSGSETGKYFENMALSYLIRQGCQLICRNFHSAFGEIDLIVKQNDVYVFTEVRYRDNPDRGLAQETISKTKQQKIIKTAMFFLQKFHLDQVNCRFDVIAFNGPYSQTQQPEWIQDAFQID